jgi:hypothetical protein
VSCGVSDIGGAGRNMGSKSRRQTDALISVGNRRCASVLWLEQARTRVRIGTHSEKFLRHEQASFLDSITLLKYWIQNEVVVATDGPTGAACAGISPCRTTRPARTLALRTGLSTN